MIFQIGNKSLRQDYRNIKKKKKNQNITSDQSQTQSFTGWHITAFWFCRNLSQYCHEAVSEIAVLSNIGLISLSISHQGPLSCSILVNSRPSFVSREELPTWAGGVVYLVDTLKSAILGTCQSIKRINLDSNWQERVYW